MEQKEHTGEQTLTDNQRELVKEQTMPAEVNMEHPDEHIAPTEGQKVPTEKATDEKQKKASVEKETSNEEQKVPIEEQHATTEEEKTSREGEKALVEGQREDAQEEREVGVGVALPCQEDDVTHATAGTDEVDSKETDANNEVERQEEQEVNQAKQEVTDSHSQLAQRASDADRMVDLEQEQHGVENDGVPPQPLVEHFKGPAAVVESDVPEEPELGGSEQLHPSPTDEESRQPEAFKSTSSKEVWDGVSADDPASKVSGTDSHEMEEKLDGDVTGQNESGDGGGKEVETVPAAIGAEQEEDVSSGGIEYFQQEGSTVAISVDAQAETAEDSRVGTRVLEGTEEVKSEKVAVKGEEGQPVGEGVEHITEDSGETDIPTGQEEEEELTALGEGGRKSKGDELKAVGMEELLPYAVSVVDVDRYVLTPEEGAAMDFSETNTEDSDSSYPDDLVPSQL